MLKETSAEFWWWTTKKLVVKYIASVISKLGYPNVFQATNATEARAHLQAEKIALIISDVCLPDGDGRQLLREGDATL